MAFIESTLNTLFGPIISAIQNTGNAYTGGVAAACAPLSNDIQNTGSVSESTKAQLSNAILGDMFVTVATIATVITAAMTILSVITLGGGMVASMVIGAVVSMIVVMALDSIVATIDFTFDANNPLNQIMGELLTWSGVSIGEDDVLALAIDGLIGMFDAFAMAFLKVCPGLTKEQKNIARDVAFAVTGLALAVFSAGLVHDEIANLVNVVALVMSVAGLTWGAFDLAKEIKDKNPNSSPKIVLAISSVISIVGVAKNIGDIVWDLYDE